MPVFEIITIGFTGGGFRAALETVGLQSSVAVCRYQLSRLYQSLRINGLFLHAQAAETAASNAKKNLGAAQRLAARDINKAMRLVNKALDFEEVDESLDSSDYELLLSAAGATEKTLNIRGTYTQTFAIPSGSAFVWKARVKKNDIGFAVKEVKDQQPPVDIEPLNRYTSNTLIQGQIAASSQARNISLIFDNTHSFEIRRVVYWVACGENVTLADDAVGAARSKEVKAAEEGPSE